MTENFFESGITPKRVFQVTGKVAEVRWSKDRHLMGVLIIPGTNRPKSRRERYNHDGIWLTGRIPADRDPRFSALREIYTGQVYIFDIAATGNKFKLPDAPHRVDFEIIKFKQAANNTFGDCRGEFCISGWVVAVHMDYIVLQSRPLPSTQDHPVLESRLLALRYNPKIIQFQVGQKALLRVALSPSVLNKNNILVPVPSARIIETGSLPDNHVNNQITQDGVREYTRKGHWRKLPDGNSTWVRATTVRRSRQTN